MTIEREGGMVATSGSQFVVCQSNPCLFGSCSAGTFIIGSTTTAWYVTSVHVGIRKGMLIFCAVEQPAA